MLGTTLCATRYCSIFQMRKLRLRMVKQHGQVHTGRPCRSRNASLSVSCSALKWLPRAVLHSLTLSHLSDRLSWKCSSSSDLQVWSACLSPPILSLSLSLWLSLVHCIVPLLKPVTTTVSQAWRGRRPSHLPCHHIPQGTAQSRY